MQFWLLKENTWLGVLNRVPNRLSSTSVRAWWPSIVSTSCKTQSICWSRYSWRAFPSVWANFARRHAWSGLPKSWARIYGKNILQSLREASSYLRASFSCGNKLSPAWHQTLFLMDFHTYGCCATHTRHQAKNPLPWHACGNVEMWTITFDVKVFSSSVRLEALVLAISAAFMAFWNASEWDRPLFKPPHKICKNFLLW